jgi:hypothetical protein
MKKYTIALDFDKTLAYSDDDHHSITNQDVIPIVKEKILQRMKDGDKVILFSGHADSKEHIKQLREWLDKNGLEKIKEITNVKSHDIDEFWDDRAISVTPNIGITNDFLPRYREDKKLRNRDR